MRNTDIDRLKSLSVDELFVELGGSLLGRQAVPAPEDERRSTGRRWFEAKRELLQSIICESEQVRRQHERLAAERTTVIAAIADLVGSVCVGVSPFVVSALVVKHGLESFCASFWCADECVLAASVRKAAGWALGRCPTCTLSGEDSPDGSRWSGGGTQDVGAEGEPGVFRLRARAPSGVFFGKGG